MIVKRVTRVELIRNTELWRVEWTEVRNGKANQGTQTHYTEAAARRHVEGLLRMRASGLSIDSIYTERI